MRKETVNEYHCEERSIVEDVAGFTVTTQEKSSGESYTTTTRVPKRPSCSPFDRYAAKLAAQVACGLGMPASLLTPLDYFDPRKT